MKLFAFSVRDDEEHFFKDIAEELGLEARTTPHPPTLAAADTAAGAEYVSIITTPITAELMERFRSLGVKMISTRTVGYEHIDLEAARRLGMAVGHATYSPGSVADYALMLMLACLRNLRAALRRSDAGDYTLQGLRARELSHMTVGILGTGAIGTAVIRRLSGFGCRILAFDPFPNTDAGEHATYVDMYTLLAESDLVSLHIPANKENDRLINKERIAKMKHGVVLINTARGAVVDTNALIEALETGKISAAGLDTVEGEGPIFYQDFRTKPAKLHDLAVLKDMPNVVMTPHVAFYTDTAVREMVYASLKSCLLESRGEKNPWKVV